MGFGLNLIQQGGACAASSFNLGYQLNQQSGGFSVANLTNGGTGSATAFNLGSQINASGDSAFGGGISGLAGSNAMSALGGGMDLSSLTSGLTGELGEGLTGNTQQMMSNLLGGIGGGMGMDMSSLGLGSMPGFGGMNGMNGMMGMGGMNGMNGQGSILNMMNMMLQMMQMQVMMMMMQMMQQMSQTMGGMMGGNGCGADGMGGMNGIQGQQAAGGSGNSTVDIARQFLGQTTHDIKGLKHLDKSIGYNLNCANFVSACLQQSGRLEGHYNGCKGLEQALKQQGWKQVPASQAQPGDVWFNAKRGHTEIVEKAGNPPTLIGSNNGGDSIQEVSEDRGSGRGGVFYHKA